MAAGAVAFSLMSVFVKWAGQSLPTMQIVLARSVVVGALSGAILLARGSSLVGGEPRLLLLRGVLGFVALTCFYFAVVMLPLADATVIQYTNPVFTAILAALFLGEVLRGREVAVAVACLGGVVLVARPTALFGASPEALDPVGVAVGVTGAVFSAAAYVTVRRLKAEESMLVVFWFAAVSTVASLPAVVPVWETPDWAGWGILAGVGGWTFLGQIFLTLGLKHERAGPAMAVGYLQIVFAAIWGVLFFAEIPDGWSVLGALVIVGGLWALARMRPTPSV